MCYTPMKFFFIFFFLVFLNIFFLSSVNINITFIFSRMIFFGFMKFFLAHNIFWACKNYILFNLNLSSCQILKRSDRTTSYNYLLFLLLLQHLVIYRLHDTIQISEHVMYEN